MRVHLTDVKVGDRLSAEIFNNYGIHVLSAGKELTKEDINKLSLHDIEYIDIILRDQFITVPNNTKSTIITRQIQPHYQTAVSRIKELFIQVKEDGMFDDKQINDDLAPLVENFKNERDVVSLLIGLNSKDDYTYQHSVQVGMISHFLAKWLGKDEKEAYAIGKSGYLHDIGKSMIGSDILQKPDKLTDDEFEEVKKHTIYGYDIVNKSIDDKLLALSALQHHERCDGTGYPHAMKSNKIHLSAKIIAVADVYSAMISSRVYQKKRDLLFVLKELNRLSFSQLDPFITLTFIKHMIPNFIGKQVNLKSGEIGTIVMNNPNDFFHPLIKIENKFIDLSKNHEDEIDFIFI